MLIGLDSDYRRVVDGRFSGHDIAYYNRQGPSVRAVLEPVKEAHILGFRRGFGILDREILAELPSLQFIHKTGSGVDWFDLDALTELGIILANNTGFNASSVAEHTMILILLSLRNAYQHLADMRAGIWKQTPPPGDVVMLEGKTVGIVGLGQIGSHVARRVLAFGANVIAYQRHPNPQANILSDIRWVSLDTLLREADVVVLSVPFTTQTEKLIGARELGLMKPTAVLVNTSRGKVVDEKALYEALAAGRLRGAGLDVFEEEPTPADNPLLKLPNVLATPHIGGYSSELNAKQSFGALDNIDRFLQGEVPLRIANPEVLATPQLRASHLRRNG